MVNTCISCMLSQPSLFRNTSYISDIRRDTSRLEFKLIHPCLHSVYKLASTRVSVLLCVCMSVSLWGGADLTAVFRPAQHRRGGRPVHLSGWRAGGPRDLCLCRERPWWGLGMGRVKCRCLRQKKLVYTIGYSNLVFFGCNWKGHCTLF